MRGILIRWLILAFSIVITAYILPGIRVKGFVGALIVAAILAIVNAFLRPIIVFFSLPLLILTLGLFSLIINGLMLYLVSAMTDVMKIDGFIWAILGSVCISVVNSVLGAIIK